jgi:hypothetical protein
LVQKYEKMVRSFSPHALRHARVEACTK